MLQNLDASGHRERTLSETVRMYPLNKTSHPSSISKPRPGMWQRGQSPVSHRVCFSTPLACCGICHQSREVNLSELKKSSTAKNCPFSWWRRAKWLHNSRNGLGPAHSRTMAGSHSGSVLLTCGARRGCQPRKRLTKNCIRLAAVKVSAQIASPLPPVDPTLCAALLQVASHVLIIVDERGAE